jgi:hypothetical protein
LSQPLENNFNLIYLLYNKTSLFKLQAKAEGLSPYTDEWSLDDEQVQSVMEFNTDPHLILYRGVTFDKDSEFIRSFYKYNKAPPLKGAVTSFSPDANIVINWLHRIVPDKNKYYFVISVIVPLGFPIFNIPKMNIGGKMEEIAIPNIYNKKHLMLHLLSKRHLSLSGPEFANEIPRETLLERYPNFYILNCSLSYEAAPFEESIISKTWYSWETRFQEKSAKIKATINDISKEKMNGLEKHFMENGEVEFIKLTKPNEYYCYFHNDYKDPEYIYLSALSKESLEDCKKLSGLSGWYDLHKEL